MREPRAGASYRLAPHSGHSLEVVRVVGSTDRAVKLVTVRSPRRGRVGHKWWIERGAFDRFAEQA